MKTAEQSQPYKETSFAKDGGSLEAEALEVYVQQMIERRMKRFFSDRNMYLKNLSRMLNRIVSERG